MNIDNIISEINNADDKRSVILEAENEISKLTPFNHEAKLVPEAYGVNADFLDSLLDQIPHKGKDSIVGEFVEKIFTKRELAMYFVAVLKHKS